MDTTQHDEATDAPRRFAGRRRRNPRLPRLTRHARGYRRLLPERAGRWPIGKTAGDGGRLIASKRRLIHHAEKDHARLTCRLTRFRAASGPPSLRRLSPEKAAPVLKIERSRLCWNAPYIGHRSPDRQQASSRRRSRTTPIGGAR